MTIKQFRKYYLQRLAPSYAESLDIAECLNYIDSRTTALTDAEVTTLTTTVNYAARNFTPSVQQYIEDIIHTIFVEEGAVSLIQINEGETFTAKLTLDIGDDWSGYNLVGKLDEDNSYLTVLTQAGFPESTTPIQYLEFDDIGGFSVDSKLHKVNLILEEESGGTATGEGIRLVGSFYLVLKQNTIDNP